jgi:guanylate kinase
MTKIKNNIIIISGPSGAGEDSIIAGLYKYLPIEKIITTTTRPKRVNEKQAKEYYFITMDKFKKGISENIFFEYAQEYNGYFYGVTRSEIERVKKLDKIGIWKIEYKGVINAKKFIPDIKAILIMAPIKILEKRIRLRDNVDEQYIKQRTEYTREWLKHKHIYDYTVLNKEGKLDKTIDKVVKIIKSEMKSSAQKNTVDKN